MSTDLFGTKIKQPPRPWKFEGEPALRALSLGAGVQSSTLLYLAIKGIVTPKPDCAIFADTGWEPPEVYEHLDYLTGLAEAAGIAVHVVSAGDLRATVMNGVAGKRIFVSLPLFTRNLNGSDGRLRRQCTREYKVEPITKKLRELIGLVPRQRVPRTSWVEQWIGISLDEMQRMRDNREPWINNRHPLIELRMRREHCVEWAASHGYQPAPKSACIGCPYHDNAYWREMKESRPEQFADAVEFDEHIRDSLPGVNMPGFLHRSLIPLSEVKFDKDDDPTGSLFGFGDECEGMCGV